MCGNASFELVPLEPGGSRFKVRAVCCDLCGSVVGVEPWENTAELLDLLAQKLGVKLEDQESNT